MKDDYYDNGLESAELENSGHSTKIPEPYHHEFVKLEEQFGSSQLKVAEINWPQGYSDAQNAEIQTLTCEKTNIVLKPSVSCLSLHIDNNKCVDASQHKKQVEKMSLLKEDAHNEDKNTDSGPENKLCSKDKSGNGECSCLSPSGMHRQLPPERKQDKDEVRAQDDVEHRHRSLEKHDYYPKIETIITHSGNKNKFTADRLKVEHSNMMLHLNQDNALHCENTDFYARNNPATGTNPKPSNRSKTMNTTETFRGRKSPKHETVSNETKVGKFKQAGNNASTVQPKKIQAVATSHGKLCSTCVCAGFLRKILMLSILSSVTLSQEDTWPLPETKIVLAGSNVRLDCLSNSENPIDWDYKPSDTRTTQRLYYGNLGLMSDDVSKRYSVDANTFLRRYDLIITNVLTEDSGRYQCTEIFNEERQKLLELVVIKEAPVCNTQSLNNGAMGEAVFDLRQRPVVLKCSVAITDNKNLTLSIVSTNSTSYPNITAMTKSESTVTVLMKIFPLPALSLNNEVFKCKVSVSEPSADASANDDSISCFYRPVIINYAVIEPILNPSRSKTCNDVEKHSWCNPPCSYHFSEIEPGLCSCTVSYINETLSFSWKCDDSNDIIAWKVAAVVIGLVAFVLISLAAIFQLQRNRNPVCGNYKIARQDPDI